MYRPPRPLWKRILRAALSVLLLVALLFVGYVAYLLIDYHRIPDAIALDVTDKTDARVRTGEEYTLLSYNIGFAAYTPDFGFFMDGGSESRAASEASVRANMADILAYLRAENDDFLMLEEVDLSATRTYGVDERGLLIDGLPAEDGRELVLYTVHLSAYTSDGTVATKQLEMLLSDMQAEYEKGNYAVAGGDFNKDLLGDSAAIFGISGEGQTWAQPIPPEAFDGVDIRLAAPFDPDHPVPSCRNADGPYTPSQFVLTVDGFLLSPNVTEVKSEVISLGFAYSDHNPVRLTFRLGGE